VLFALVYLLLRRFVRALAGPSDDLSSDVELIVLRYQLMVLKRRAGGSRLRRRDRLFMAAMSRTLPLARWSSFVVTPQTLLRWHRELVRPWDVADAAAVMDAFRVPDIQHWHMRRFHAEDEAIAWIGAWHERWRAETDASWAVTTGVSVAGYAALRDMDLEFGTAEVTYWVLPPFRQRGLATLATLTISAWALDEVGLPGWRFGTRSLTPPRDGNATHDLSFPVPERVCHVRPAG
jgi:RimJ/RimL family protein N-acetyltransferase